VRLDHLIFAVTDLATAAPALGAATGLAVLPGGVHAAWGTRNAIVPLGDAYLELVEVADPEVAARSAFGRVVAAAARGRGLAPAGWAVAPDDLDSAAARAGVAVLPGRRELAGGGTLSWSMAGADEALARGLPFFLRWDDEASNPARVAAEHRVEPAGVRWIEVGGSREQLEAWLGPHELDVRVLPGAPPGLRRAAIGVRGGGEIVLPAG
jgi:hypothetical protein